MGLEAQQSALTNLGFDIVASEGDEVIGVAQRWHLDCLLTKLTYVVFVREVPRLTAAMIEADRSSLEARARDLDSSRLPRGLQKGVAVLSAYIADSIDDDARQLCTSKPKTRFAFFFMPGVLDRTTEAPLYLRQTPAWGAIYFSKFRFILDSVLKPGPALGSWPISVGGAILSVFAILAVLMSLGLAFAP